MIEAIVCRSLDYKDSSKILYLYTNEGVKSVVARGVKKLTSINRFLSQVPNHIKYTPSKGSFPSLKEGELLTEFGQIELDLEVYSYVSHILELTVNVIDEDNDHSKMFDFILRLLKMYNQSFDPEILTFIFELKLLYFLGFGIRFNGCSRCTTPNNLVYSIRNGGLICKEHLEPLEESYDEEIYKKIKDLYYMDINQYSQVSISKNERIIIRHIIDIMYDDYIGYKSKSRSIIKQIKKY